MPNSPNALTLKFIPPIQRPHFLVAGLELSHAFYSVSLPWVSEPPLTRSLALKSRHAWGKFPALNQTHPPPKKRDNNKEKLALKRMGKPGLAGIMS